MKNLGKSLPLLKAVKLVNPSLHNIKLNNCYEALGLNDTLESISLAKVIADVTKQSCNKPKNRSASISTK